MKKVVKFGGSSLASAEQFKKVGNIIHADSSRRYVVPSAPGKRFSADIKVTDMLYDCYGAAEREEDFTEKLAAIKARYQEIIDGLGLKFSLMNAMNLLTAFPLLIKSDFPTNRFIKLSSQSEKAVDIMSLSFRSRQNWI